MTIKVRTGGNTVNVDNVSTKNVTIVQKVTVGKPVRKIDPRIINIDEIRGIDTSGKQDGDSLVWNATEGVWKPEAISASSSLTIDTLSGVDTSTKINGSVLIYNTSTENFEASTLLEEQTINGGQY